MSEVERIHERYERRTKAGVGAREVEAYVARVKSERQALYARILRSGWPSLDDVSLLEIGAGSGDNLRYFRELGMAPANLVANELLPERVETLRSRFPDVEVHPGNALELDFDGRFDVVFQSMVFTSILDAQFRKDLAAAILRWLKPGGICLWYDFVYDNPRNPDVRGIPTRELTTLFSDASSIETHKVTLAPPIGRRVPWLYTPLNAVPWLRTHVVAVIRP